jgi:hypothetical protein
VHALWTWMPTSMHVQYLQHADTNCFLSSIMLHSWMKQKQKWWRHLEFPLVKFHMWASYNTIIQQITRHHPVRAQTSSIFSKATMTGASYLYMPKIFIFPWLEEEEAEIFQQDGELLPFSNLSVSFQLNPCGGGVEYLHREPASRKRRQNGTKKGRAIA